MRRVEASVLKARGWLFWLASFLWESEGRMELSEYNGWENRFTWLMHLHLSSEQGLMQEVAALVTTVSNNRKAGKLLATWVKTTIFNWMCSHPDRDSRFDENMGLLAWDLAGSALAYADWDELLALLAGRVKKSKNLFTVTLSHFILSDGRLLAAVQEMREAFSNVYECADAVKGWFTEQVDVLFNGGDGVPQATFSALVNELIQNTYAVIAWPHVARAFRPGY